MRFSPSELIISNRNTMLSLQAPDTGLKQRTISSACIHTSQNEISCEAYPHRRLESVVVTRDDDRFGHIAHGLAIVHRQFLNTPERF